MFPIFFFFENHAVYEIMWKNIAQPDKPQMTIWRMRIECWIPKVTNTHSDYVIINAFSPATMVVRMRVNITFIPILPVLFKCCLLFFKFLKDRHNWGDPGVDGRILGWISRRWDKGIWTGLGWPRIETGGGRL